MRRYVAAVCFVALFATSAMAAGSGGYPKAEVYGGYEYSHLGGGSFNMNGWDLGFNGNFNDHFGIAADLGAGYTSRGGIAIHNFTYTFGPVLSLRKKSYTPFVHALIGGDHESGSVPRITETRNGFALMAGGGVDFRLNRYFAFRAAQADWFLLHGNGNNSINNFRIVSGVVARF